MHTFINSECSIDDVDVSWDPDTDAVIVCAVGYLNDDGDLDYQYAMLNYENSDSEVWNYKIGTNTVTNDISTVTFDEPGDTDTAVETHNQVTDDGDINYKVAWLVPVDGGDSGMNYENYLGAEVEISLRVFIMNDDSDVDETSRGELIDFPNISDFESSESEGERAKANFKITFTYLVIVIFASALVFSLASSLNGR